MNFIFVNACYEDGQYLVDVKTFIIINIYKLSESCNVILKIRIIKELSSPCIAVDLNNLNFEAVTDVDDLTKLCIWPIILLNNYVVSGLCSVARQLCKLSDNESVQKLLGFREACLVACAESSVWTKYCEIDITHTVNGILNNDFIDCSSFRLPPDILKYENHLSQPVRMHNIYKVARDNHNDQSLKSSTPRKDLRILHNYAEGPYITLADLILYPCFQIFFKYCHEHYKFCVESNMPLIGDWFNRLKEYAYVDFSLKIKVKDFENNIIIPKVNNVSLYNADPTRNLPIKHTKQYKIESALKLIEGIKSEIINNNNLPFGYEAFFDWKSIPIDANPRGGALPAKRADRKCEQLENLAKAAIEVCGDKKYRIVDFCSGSGHLGILVALLLPNCEIILVENKEMSLARARETISKLNLTNVIVVQSNLDYFIGTFDLGIALHACGVATDLVLQMCIKNKADFICCPCCYGGIKDCHEVAYPRSAIFQGIFSKFSSQYFNLAHAADQTHELENAKTMQGYFCMDVIDTDRKCYAEGCGYKVHLGKLQPVTCTNKNNLLVGICTKN